ncbi:MAG: ABC transporter ATP-binding protein [Anaerolineales bacterium]|nr:ABC transporter ATP-binding protein [Anaerolineales bacterium]
MSLAVTVKDLGKKFNRYRTDRPKTFKGVLFGGLERIKPLESFWALRNVSLDVTSGKALGIIGSNGAGKSTLLQLIGGIGCPDEGNVSVKGHIGALFSPSSGLTPELTGRENVYINGVIAGLTRKQVAQRFDSIVDFAELEDYIDSPMRTYSSGMQTRLGFAVTIHTEPDILLIDEALSVGDIKFQQKCIDRINRFKTDGCAILLVSHSTSAIKDFCDEALWLHRGEPMAYGPADIVVDRYITDARTGTPGRDSTDSNNGKSADDTDRFGSREIEIVSFNLYDRNYQQVKVLNSGDALNVEIGYLAHKPIPSPIFIVTIKRMDRTICFTTNSKNGNIQLDTVDQSGTLSLHIERLDLVGGQYMIDVSIHEQSYTYVYDYHLNSYPLIVRPTCGEKGILNPPAVWEK